VAWLNVVLHVFGLVCAVLWMRPGTPAVGVSERLAYLQADLYPLGWSLGWLVWMLCVPALVAFMALTAHRLGEPSSLARLAVVVVVAGAAFDVFCDSAYIIVLPYLARKFAQPQIFLTAEKLLGIGSLVVANGFYSLATLLMTRSLRGRAGMSPFVTPVGYGVTAFGLLLSAAAFPGEPWLIEWSTGPTIGLYCVWVLLVAYSLEPLERPA
jgi:hypothetical protein